MTMQWQSDRWGSFTWDYGEWITRQTFPSDRFGLKADRSATYKLAFKPSDSETPPSRAAIQLAEELLADPDWLVELITKALFDDFQGDGPGSGMWWDGDIDAVEEILGVEIPDEPEQLATLLYLTEIAIQDDHRFEIDGPLAVIGFGAPFEEEHGVEFLTDGKEVFGIGYATQFGL